MNSLDEDENCIEGFGYQIDEGGLAETKTEELFHNDDNKIMMIAKDTASVSDLSC